MFSVYSCQNLIPCFLTFCSTELVDPFDPYQFLIFYHSSLLAFYGIIIPVTLTALIDTGDPNKM